MKRLLTKTQVAELVGVHPETVMRWARQGSFPRPIRLGSNNFRCAVRFDGEDIEAWLTERKRDAAAGR